MDNNKQEFSLADNIRQAGIEIESLLDRIEHQEQLISKAKTNINRTLELLAMEDNEER